jgi:hypothetical protein
LQGWFLLGIGVGFTTVTSQAPSQGTVEPLQMIGVNICGGDILRGVRVFWLRGLIFGSLASTAMTLAAFILEPGLDTGL